MTSSAIIARTSLSSTASALLPTKIMGAGFFLLDFLMSHTCFLMLARSSNVLFFVISYTSKKPCGSLWKGSGRRWYRRVTKGRWEVVYVSGMLLQGVSTLTTSVGDWASQPFRKNDRSRPARPLVEMMDVICGGGRGNHSQKLRCSWIAIQAAPHLAVFNIQFHHGRELLGPGRVDNFQHHLGSVEINLSAVAILH